jgi:3-deoxy-D-manno-octulosonic acid (KDO) 8-phosphate synthase
MLSDHGAWFGYEQSVSDAKALKICTWKPYPEGLILHGSKVNP